MAEETREITIILKLDDKKYSVSAKSITKETKAATGSIKDLKKRLKEAQDYFESLPPKAKNYGTALKRVENLQNLLSKSVQKSTKDLSKFGAASVKTGYALLNLNRIVSDAPFGFIAISNNIEPAVQSFINLRKASGGTKQALITLGKSLIGPLGIMTAFTAVTAAVTYFSLNTEKAKNLIEEFSLENLLGEFSEFDKALKKVAEDVKDIPTDELEGKLAKLRENLNKTNQELAQTLFTNALISSQGFGASIINKIFGTDENKIEFLTQKIIAFYKAINEGGKQLETPGILNQLYIKLRKLRKARDEAFSEKQIREFNAEIKQTEQRIDELLGRIKPRDTKITFKVIPDFEKSELFGAQKRLFNKLKENFIRQGLTWNAETKEFAFLVATQLKEPDKLKPTGLKKVKVPKQPEVKLTTQEVQKLRTEADITAAAFQTMANSITDAMFGAKLSIGDLISEVGKLIAKLTLVATIKKGLQLAFPTLAPFFHSGGLGFAPPQFAFVNPSAFKGARKFHSGGIPAIIKEDEMVLTKQQQRNLFNMIAAGRSGTGGAAQRIKIDLRAEMKAIKDRFVLEFEEASYNFKNSKGIGRIDRS